MSSNVKGSFAYENCKLAQIETSSRGTFEYPLFTDAHIIDEYVESESPYKLFNLVSLPNETKELVPAIVLRIDNYIEPDISVKLDTEESRYHGGGIEDEIASLVSLCLGIRCKAGGISRHFEPNNDSKG